MTAAPGVGVDWFHVRAVAFLTLRADYLRSAIAHHRGSVTTNHRVLMVGADRGLLAREMARHGCVVCALEPDTSVARLAARLADTDDTTVDIRVGAAEQLPYPDESFDVGHWADTLEITQNLDAVLAEAARVLRPGGVFVYDTVAPTPLSRVLYLGALQAWVLTRIAPRGRYAWERFRDPDELVGELARHGLRNSDIRGFQPANPLRLFRAVRRARRGQVDDGQLAALAGMRLATAGKRPAVTYLGYAVREPGASAMTDVRR